MDNPSPQCCSGQAGAIFFPSSSSSPLCQAVLQVFPLEQIQDLTTSCHSLVPNNFISYLDPRETFLTDLTASVPASFQPLGSTPGRAKPSHWFAHVHILRASQGLPSHAGPHGLHPIAALALISCPPLLCMLRPSLTHSIGGHPSAPAQPASQPTPHRGLPTLFASL